MKQWKKYRLNIRGRCFNVAVYGSTKDFASFRKQCATCKVKCNRGIFIECINTKEQGLLVFKNMAEAGSFMTEMLFF